MFSWTELGAQHVGIGLHIPDIIIAAMRGKVRWRSRVKAPGGRRTWSTRGGRRGSLGPGTNGLLERKLQIMLDALFGFL